MVAVAGRIGAMALAAMIAACGLPPVPSQAEETTMTTPGGTFWLHCRLGDAAPDAFDIDAFCEKLRQDILRIDGRAVEAGAAPDGATLVELVLYPVSGHRARIELSAGTAAAGGLQGARRQELWLGVTDAELTPAMTGALVLPVVRLAG